MTSNIRSLLADAILVFHFIYAAFVVMGFVGIGFGAILDWKWIRNFAFRVTHLVAITIVGIEAIIGMTCPLTDIEYLLRRGTESGGEQSFIGRLVSSWLYYDLPVWVFSMIYLLLTTLALALVFFVPPKKNTKTAQ